jgi:ATP-binding cassette subfamily A (ABC1) protein 3
MYIHVLLLQLKGCPRSKLKDEVDGFIKAIGLEQKRKALSMTLSGGQKRKLSVAIALIADSKASSLQYSPDHGFV